MDKGAWRATVHGVTRNLTGLSDWASVQFSHSVISNSLWPHGLQHAKLPYPSPTPGACSNSCPSSQWHHPTISPSVAPFSSRLQSFTASGSFPVNHPTFSSSVVPFSSRSQSFPALGSFPMSQLFALGGQSIGASVSASVLPMIIQDWFSWGLSGLISLQSKGLSRIFSNTTVQKHQFFGAQSSYIHTRLLEKS